MIGQLEREIINRLVEQFLHHQPMALQFGIKSIPAFKALILIISHLYDTPRLIQRLLEVCARMKSQIRAQDDEHRDLYPLTGKQIVTA